MNTEGLSFISKNIDKRYLVVVVGFCGMFFPSRPWAGVWREVLSCLCQKKSLSAHHKRMLWLLSCRIPSWSSCHGKEWKYHRPLNSLLGVSKNCLVLDWVFKHCNSFFSAHDHHGGLITIAVQTENKDVVSWCAGKSFNFQTFTSHHEPLLSWIVRNKKPTWPLMDVLNTTNILCNHKNPFGQETLDLVREDREWRMWWSHHSLSAVLQSSSDVPTARPKSALRKM